MNKNFKVISTFLILTCLLLALVSCGGNTEKAEANNQQNAEQKQQQSNGAKVEQPVSTSSTNKWPSDIPGYVPQLKGDVSDVKEAASTKDYAQYYHIIYENIEDTMDSYEKELVSNGWAITVSTDLEAIWSINARYNNDKAYLTVTVYKDNSLEREEKSGDFVLGIVR